MPSDSAEDSDSNKHRPLQVAVQPRGRPRSRGQPPGQHARSRTPPRQWTDQLTNEAPKRFTGAQPGPRDDHSDKSELETFELLFTEEFVRTVVILTNMNYHKKSEKSPNKHKMKWQDVTRDASDSSLQSLKKFYCEEKVDLYSKLYLDGCMGVETLRENRKELPRDSVGKKKELVKKLKRGKSLYRQSDNMYCATWKDTKNVYMLSTVPTTNASEQVNRMVKQDGKWTKINIDRPNIIGLYNKYMGGVDLADKKIACYKRQT